MYSYVCVCMCSLRVFMICICLHACLYVCTCVSVCVWACARVCLCEREHVRVCVCVCVWVCVWVCVCVCVGTRVYIYVSLHSSRCRIFEIHSSSSPLLTNLENIFSKIVLNDLDHLSKRQSFKMIIFLKV